MKTLQHGMRSLGISSVLVAVLVVGAACGTGSREGGNIEMGASKIRQPAVAGQFYPGTPEELREAVSSMLEKAQPPKIRGRIVALISPHAGYMYSGQIAADGYRTIQGKQFDAVVIVAPSHRMRFQGSSIYREGRFKTPLGLIEIAGDIADAIAKADSSVQFRDDAQAQEHSLEVQLPFLQITVPGLRIVPIVMGDQSITTARRLAKAIAGAVKGKNVLLVASTDLSHFHDYNEAVRLDQIVIDHIRNYDPEGLARDLDLEQCEACGGGPVVTVMLAAREIGASRGVVFKYANSGDVTGDKSSVVGYLAAALVAEDAVGVDLGLKHSEKAELLSIARQAIEAALLDEHAPEVKATSPLLREKMGAFVTLTERGDLRGCIGNIVGVEPLVKTISNMAIAAATEDPRFPSVTIEELKEIEIEISVLTPLRKITNPEEIEVGRDGIYLEKGFYHGLLLPQVATEYGWDRYQFLDNTCLKAGLPRGCWREGATIQIFSAQVFNEAEVLKRPSSK